MTPESSKTCIQIKILRRIRLVSWFGIQNSEKKGFVAKQVSQYLSRLKAHDLNKYFEDFVDSYLTFGTLCCFVQW